MKDYKCERWIICPKCETQSNDLLCIELICQDFRQFKIGLKWLKLKQNYI